MQIPAPGRLYVIGENVVGGGGLAGNSDSSSRLTSALQDPYLLRQGKALRSRC